MLFQDGKYHMWFDGHDNLNVRIGHATSPDGLNWTKSESNPVLNLRQGGSWDDSGVFSATVLYQYGHYHMWYAGGSGLRRRIGFATSNDGVYWVKYASNPIMYEGPSGEWDDYRVRAPSVLCENGIFHMWYRGDDGSKYRIGYATSNNGVDWAKSVTNPVLDIGPSGGWEETYVGDPSVYYKDGIFRMWYFGGNKSGSSSIFRIGYATDTP